MLGCPRCGAPLTAGARFCSACGAALPSETAPRAVRKAVTVVFTDVAGFTGLTERLDPERLRRVMSRYFAEMRSVVERHGGVVEKFIGDAVMAIFGIPRLHEDDALRAVRAAAEMREALDSLNRDLERAWGVTVEVRTGVDTGEVATGGDGVGDPLVLGDSVNVAARLQQAAGPHEILLGADTYRLVADAVDVEPMSGLTLKGKSGPVPAFRLLGLRVDWTGPMRRLDAPMVGRQAELAMLRDALDRVVAERSCHLVVVLGVAGAGKTRLVREFVRSAGSEVEVVQGHCPSYGEGITFWPVAEVVRQAAGIGPDDGEAASRARLEAVLGEDADGAVVGHLSQVLGLAGATAGSEDIFWAVRKLLEAVARRKPLIVVFEDLHWAQPTFLDFLEHLADWVRDAPVLVCCPARPDFLDEHEGWREERAHVSSLELGPLSDDDSRQVVENLLHGEELSRRGRFRIVGAARGNPLFLEEMLSMLVDSGLLHKEHGRWVPADDLQDAPLPLTLQSLLVTRLDRLEPGERQVVEVASVMGTVFSRRALVDLVIDQPEAEVRTNLRQLTAKGMVRTASSSASEDAMEFQHPLLREAAYNGMSKEARADVHERFADWLDRPDAPHHVGDDDEFLGYHLEHAFLLGRELRPVDDHAAAVAQRGGERLAAAGRTAFSRGDVVAAVNLLSRATRLLPVTDPVRLSVLPSLSEALMMTGQVERAGATLEEAAQASARQGARAVEAHLVLVRTTQRLFVRPQGWADAARREVQRTIPVFEEVGDDLGLARSWRLLGLIDFVRGQSASAGAAVDRAGVYAHMAGDRREELESLSWLPLALFTGPAPAADGIARCREIVERAGSDRKVEASVLLTQGALEAMRRDIEGARRSLATARATFEDLGLRFWLAGPVAYLTGWVEMLVGDAVGAERVLRPGFEALREMGHSSWLTSTVAGLLAHSLYAQERYDEAEDLATTSERITRSDDVFSQVVGRAARAKVLSARGDAADAESVGGDAVRLAAGTDCIQLQGEALLDLAEVHRRRGRPDRAAELAGHALDRFERKGNQLAADRLAATLGAAGP
ncbi:MAG: AAA family ATPase [Actinomycetota bacterium]|nr:AAA family ATPase [Actinomycetota bacterium]